MLVGLRNRSKNLLDAAAAATVCSAAVGVGGRMACASAVPTIVKEVVRELGCELSELSASGASPVSVSALRVLLWLPTTASELERELTCRVLLRLRSDESPARNHPRVSCMPVPSPAQLLAGMT